MVVFGESFLFVIKFNFFFGMVVLWYGRGVGLYLFICGIRLGGDFL